MTSPRWQKAALVVAVCSTWCGSPRLALLEGQESKIHVYEARAGKVRVDDLKLFEVAALLPSIHSPINAMVPGQELDRLLDAAHRDRARELGLIEALPPHQPVLPNSGRLHPDTLYMSLADVRASTSPRDTRRVLDRRQFSLIQQIADIGETEGFDVTVLVADNQPEALAAVREVPRLGLVRYQGIDDIWMEDVGEMTVDHQVEVPARISDPLLVRESIRRDRILRSPGVLDATGKFEVLGRVDRLGSRRALAAVSLANGLQLREQLTYLEGGNQLIGRAPDKQRYALVGRDSLAVSRALLERDLGRSVSEAEVLRITASDLGVPPAQVFPVEQPGEFHLDMAMMSLGRKAVVLNDAEEAAALQEQWLREDFERLGGTTNEQADLDGAVRRIREAAHRRALAEKSARRDLEAAGVTVYSMAGVFYDGPVRMNLLNSLIFTNGKSERYGILFGADPRAEAYVARKLLTEIPSRLHRLYFLGSKESMPSGSGGIRCRVQAAGDLPKSNASQEAGSVASR